MGVARRSWGSGGRASDPASVESFTTGRTLGDGGIESPRRGVRLPPADRFPGIGGRNRGAGEDILGAGYMFELIQSLSIVRGWLHSKLEEILEVDDGNFIFR